VFSAARKRLLGILSFTVLTLAVVLFAFLYLYRDFQRQLDRELGARLVAAATATAAAVNDDTWDGLLARDPVVRARVREELEGLRLVNELSAVFLFDVEQITILDLAGYPEGELNPALAFDLAAVTTALAGIPAPTELYENDGDYLKAGYAPVLAADGTVVGGVGMEANAAFFAVLDRVRRAMLTAAAAVTVILIAVAVVFGRIFSAQATLEQRLRRTETLAAMGQMAAMLAHEIRNPLGIIRGSAETLAETYDLKDDEVYQFIPEEVDRLHATVSAYLDFARPGAPGGIEDVGGAVERTAGLVEPDLTRRGIRLERTLEPGDYHVQGGNGLLEQALLNLVLNSRDAMPEGGTLLLGLSREGKTAKVTVVDNGTGMSDETQRRAMEPFFTRKEKGSGLGLAVVRRTVEEIGGRMTVESRSGEGTTVTLYLELVSDKERKA